jgi:hypothetical protein
LHALGVLERPLVNEWAGLIAARLHAFQVEASPPWPNGARFAAMLSHDVDECALRLGARGPPAARARAALVRRARRRDAGRSRLATRGKDPYWNFERWLDAEDLRGSRRRSIFCAPRPGRRHEYDARYRFADPIEFERARGTVRQTHASSG